MTRTLDCCKRFLVLLLVVVCAEVLLTGLAPRQAELPAAAAQEKPKQIPLKKLPWQRAMLLDKSEETGEVDPGEEAKVWVVLARFAQGDAATVPAFRPYAVGGLLICRSFCDSRVIYIATDKKLEWTEGEIHWKSAGNAGSLATALHHTPFHGPKLAFVKLLGDAPQPALAQLVLENQMAGALSHDLQRVYMVDDLALPLPQNFDAKTGMPIGGWSSPLQVENGLRVYDLATGKIAWAFEREVGTHPLPNSHFLAAPLSLNGMLYALNETNKGEQRLILIDPAKGEIKESHALDTVPDWERYLVNQRRRLYAAQLLVDGNLMVCIPHTGKAFGIDIAKRTVLWTFNYQKNPPPKQDLGNWRSPAPFVHDGKLVFTASDDDHVHCLNVKDGKPLWKVQRADDLYLAGIVGDKVLLVGHSSCRALSLKDGNELWKLQTGTPCGIGALDKTTYLLPLKKGAASKQPEIAYLDVANGKLIGVSPLAEMPGNLLLHGEFILSQSATTVTGHKR